MKVLVALGGKAERYRVLDVITRDYKSLLSHKDLEEYTSGKEMRWKNHISFAREHLKNDGYLKNDSPRGLWEITADGKKQLTEWLELIKKDKNDS